MARYRRFIETDVLTEAKARIRHIFDLFDTVAVMFSGGKDSLVVLHLVREVQAELGMPDKVRVVFRDEELIPDTVVDFVDGYRREPWIDMTWFAVPMASSKFILGSSYAYVQWDPAREWVRPKPDFAYTLPAEDKRVFDQYRMDAFAARAVGFKGKIAFLTGIRAAESLIRYRSCVNKLNDNYINAVADTGAKNVMLAKPIFDWQEDDVFRYFYDRGIAYCPIYDHQLWNGEAMRVSTPLHAEAAKKSLVKLRTTDPHFYDRIIRVFPEVIVQERYWREIDRGALLTRYGATHEGVRQWIDDYLEDEKQHDLAVMRFDEVMIRAKLDPDSYSPAYLLKAFTTGAFKRVIMNDPAVAQRRSKA